jgi:ribokinase
MDVPQIAVIGSSNTDLIVRVPHLPAPGETILGGNLLRAPGGKGANQAVAARRLGADVAFIGCLGDDDFGDAAWANLAREGLRLDHLIRIPGATSGIALIALAESGENSIVVAPGANARLTPEHIDSAAVTIQSAQIVLAQLEVPLDAVARAFTLARAAGARTLLNAAPAQPLAKDLLALVDVLVCNESEAEVLRTIEVPELTSTEEIARAAHMAGPALIVITLGSEGCLVLTDGTVERVPAYTVPIVDTTAAGDAFIGALAVQLAQGATPVAAARYATAAAALCVGVLGAQPALPTQEAIAHFLASL